MGERRSLTFPTRSTICSGGLPICGCQRKTVSYICEVARTIGVQHPLTMAKLKPSKNFIQSSTSIPDGAICGYARTKGESKTALI